MTGDYPSFYNRQADAEQYIQNVRLARQDRLRRAARLRANLGATGLLVAVCVALSGAGGSATWQSFDVPCAARWLLPALSLSYQSDTDGTVKAVAGQAGSASSPTGGATGTLTHQPSSLVPPSYIRQRTAEPCDAQTVASNSAPTVESTAPMMGPTAPTADGLVASLLADGQTASRLAAMILRLAPGTPPERTYDLALAVARWSRNFGVRPELVVGVIYVESHFAPAARNGQYHGLGQLSPTIRAAWHAGDGYDLQRNVRATAAHLAGLVRSYGEERALGAYNTGRPCVNGYAKTVLLHAAQPSKERTP